MLEEDIVACPVCHKEISVGFIKQKKITYVVSEDCPHCKTPANKIENMLNRGSTRTRRFAVEKSYIKVDPRG